MADKPLWKVKQNTGQNEGRTLFEGLEDNARTYVEQHYPRPHFEQGDDAQADVHLVSPNGKREQYLGDERAWEFVDKPTTTRGATNA